MHCWNVDLDASVERVYVCGNRTGMCVCVRVDLSESGRGDDGGEGQVRLWVVRLRPEGASERRATPHPTRDTRDAVAAGAGPRPDREFAPRGVRTESSLSLRPEQVCTKESKCAIK